ncbi:hypothetical protein, partial [Nocardia cyriacigeorgica]|uniref:hypothetical protein n=1 Tax=Nocardia cyriacigeorgica TaxID=135487 RepID=UPI001E51B13E
VSTGVPSRQRANAGLDQNPVTSSIIFREGAPSRDPQVLIIAPVIPGRALPSMDPAQPVAVDARAMIVTDVRSARRVVPIELLMLVPHSLTSNAYWAAAF